MGEKDLQHKFSDRSSKIPNRGKYVIAELIKILHQVTDNIILAVP